LLQNLRTKITSGFTGIATQAEDTKKNFDSRYNILAEELNKILASLG